MEKRSCFLLKFFLVIHSILQSNEIVSKKEEKCKALGRE